ncbi:DUF1996 domain-containing protein [Streptomyces griseosporeus]|uniref:DUF1996 domain-containing protein n=1 Tax=Streptomyces griseosporeus TaxID=1910 RepID=UPI0036FB1A14
MLGGGGLVVANVYASATETTAQGADGTWNAVTIDCPDVGDRLGDVPDAARTEVDLQLAALDEQIARAYRQLKEGAARQDPGSAADAVVKPLQEEREATIGKIADAVDTAGDRPQGLEELVACTLRTSDDGADGGQGGSEQSQQQDQQRSGNGPDADDYADITTVPPNVPAPPLQQGASRGTFTTSCGVNAEGLFNSDNVIVAPGVSNGAHHFHDYVGNQSNTAFAGDDDLARADTSCVDKGDRSSYYWPVLRLQNGTRERDADAPGGGTEGNSGEIVTPAEVTLTFVGNPREKATAMPRLLRIITGDAKAFVNGTTNANASWSCTGYEDRQLKDRYPLCPEGSKVVRTFRFQSCWDGRNIDSANHRTHVAFTAADGSCPAGFRPIPQLVQRIVYDVDAPSLADGGRTTPFFAVDSFPEQLHKPVTDHGDFINVFDEDLMREMVDCINSGRRCGATEDPGTGTGEEPTQGPEAPQTPPASQAPPASETPPASQTAAPPETPQTSETPQTPETPQAPATSRAPQYSEAPQEQPSRTAGADEPPATGPTATASAEVPQVYASTSPTAASTHQAQGGTGSASAPAAGGDSAPPVTSSARPATTDLPQTEPQAQGGLAETGAQLWPGALGAALATAGFLLLRRTRRRPM